MEDARQFMDRVHEVAQRASKSVKAKPEKALKLKVIQQLMLWSDKVRGLPNSLARCALFTVGNRNEPRRMYAREVIASLQGIVIQYTGEELRQDDEDVFLQIVHLGRMVDVGEPFVVTGHMVLTALGWGRSSDKYKRLLESIGRLSEGTIWVTYTNEDEVEASVAAGAAAPKRKRNGYNGRLIAKLKWREEGEESEQGKHVKWQFRLDPDIINLFGKDEFTLVDWEQRLSLTSLEKWLHSFYFTHREPYAYKTSTLYTLCGNSCATLAKFRYMLKGALRNLEESGFFESASIDPRTDLVQVKRRRQTAIAA